MEDNGVFTNQDTANQDTASADSKSGKRERPQLSLPERVLVMPLGAALVVRDDVRAELHKLSRKYGTVAGIEKQLSRYQKRGIRERRRLGRRIKRRGTQIDNEIRIAQSRLEASATLVGARLESLIEELEKIGSSSRN